MSYSMFIDVKDGVATVDTAGGYIAPPDGRYSITGHVPSEDPSSYSSETISATRFDDNSLVLAQATASVLKK